MADESPKKTWALSVRERTVLIRQIAVTVIRGPDKGTRVESTGHELAIGSAEGNDLRLADEAVSRHHLVLRAHKRGVEIMDLESTNGTFVSELEVAHGFVRAPTTLIVGTTHVKLELLDDNISQPLAESDRFGELWGVSAAMRRLFPQLEQYAQSAATLLITGETGTGKEVAAESIHAASDRRDKPFIVVDCGALPRQLMESELFGHVHGAFTGADNDRVGAFEAADGGTLFLDEIGELAVELQPVLLRVLESRRFRCVGGGDEISVDVRIISATNRDLRFEVNQRRFRSDLYYRLNVLRLELPALRDRKGDVMLLAEKFWNEFRPSTAFPAELRAQYRAARWPGNVRELRNAVERAALLGTDSSPAAAAADIGPFSSAKNEVVHSFERDYIERLLTHTGGNLTKASKIAKMSRSHLRLIMEKLGIERQEFAN